MKTLLLIAIFSLTDVCFAAAGDIDDFFVSFLKGEQTVFESNKKVSRREIQRMRVEIWTAWREAVNENEEFKLAKMDKDTVVSAGKWKLPPELENNAVMNFTLFNKGKKPPYRLSAFPVPARFRSEGKGIRPRAGTHKRLQRRAVGLFRTANTERRGLLPLVAARQDLRMGKTPAPGHGVGRL